MKFHKPTRSELLLLLTPVLGVFFFALISLNIFVLPEQKNKSSSCQENLRMIVTGIKQYQNDYDYHFPPNKIGWANEIDPYLKSQSFYHCPSDQNTSNTSSKKGYMSYWMNSQLNGIVIGRISSPSKTLLIGEGNDGSDFSDAMYVRRSLPTSWLNNSFQPPFRHYGGANYAFVDGHIVRLRPDEVEHFGGRIDPFSPQ